MLDVVEPGVQTLVQDQGRNGYFAIGLPPSGPMDYFSHHVANALVGNDPAAAALETVFIGPTLHFHRDTVVAVTGAEVGLRLDGVAMPSWTTLPVRAGQVLTVGPAHKGLRSYIAVRGGVGTPVVMGSRSTYLPSAIGGFVGRELRADDVLPCANQYRPIDRDEYDAVRADVENTTYRYRRIPVEFGLAAFFDDPLTYNRSLLGELSHA